MAARGYDDTDLIARIDALLAEAPDLSRRAAIIQVAGEGSLRRIEKKMAKRDRERGIAMREIAMKHGRSLKETLLMMVEQQALSGTTEAVRWASFTSDDLVKGWVRRRVIGPLQDWFLSRNGQFVNLGLSLGVFPLVLLSVLVAVTIGYQSAHDRFGLSNEFMNALVFEDAYPWVFDLMMNIIATAAIGGLSILTLCGMHSLYCDGRVAYELAHLPQEAGGMKRYLLTEKAFYVLALSEGGANVTRIDLSTFCGIEASEHGEITVLHGNSRLAAIGVDNAHELVQLLGLPLSRRVPAPPAQLCAIPA